MSTYGPRSPARPPDGDGLQCTRHAYGRCAAPSYPSMIRSAGTVHVRWVRARGGGISMAKVLVIDDEPAIVRFLVRALDASGHVVLAAHEGSEGLRLAAEHRPELVILDLVMPGLSGA